MNWKIIVIFNKGTEEKLSISMHVFVKARADP